MNYYEYREFIRDHGGKTPDEVYEQGAWKVNIHGKQPDKKKLVLPEPKWNWSDLKDQDTFGGHGYVKPEKTKWEKLPDDKGYDSRKKELEEQRKKAAREQAAKDKAAKEKVEKLNEADAMIFQTEKQLKEFGDKLSDDKKKPIEDALEELKKAYETKELETISPALDKLNEAWKTASEEMYKAQAEAQGGAQQGATGAEGGQAGGGETKGGDDVEDVDFEEVK